MQRFLACALPFVSLLAALMIPACQDGAPLREDVSIPAATPSVGAIHNEFLELLYATLESPRHARAAHPWGAVVEAADAIADKYGARRLDEQEILEAFELGQRLAAEDPQLVVESFLEGDELDWWRRYADQATHANARAVYDEHVLRFGAPREGGDLSRFVDVAIHSAEFWLAKRGEDELHFFDPATQSVGKGWRRWGRRMLRFGVAVAVDGFAGGGASAGTGPVGGAIVGGLASYGADCLLFGCG